MTIPMLSPAPGFQIEAKSGNFYTADSQGMIFALTSADAKDLFGAQCFPVANVPTSFALLGRLLGANMNVTTDQLIPLFVGAGVPFRVRQITAKNASISLTTAVGGIFPAVSKGGTAIVATSQAYSGLTTAALALELTIVAGAVTNTVQAPGTLLYLSLTTAQGAAATADFFVFGELYK